MSRAGLFVSAELEYVPAPAALSVANGGGGLELPRWWRGLSLGLQVRL